MVCGEPPWLLLRAESILVLTLSIPLDPFHGTVRRSRFVNQRRVAQAGSAESVVGRTEEAICSWRVRFCPKVKLQVPRLRDGKVEGGDCY